MFPYLTKIVWLLLQPLAMVGILLLLGVLLSFGRRRILSRLLVSTGTLLLVLCSFTTLGYNLIAPLEARFERVAEPARIDGIVVLGGGIDTDITSARGGWEFNRSGDRYVEALRLALAHPEAQLLVAAGPAGVFGAAGEEPEAEAARRFFVAFGVSPERLIIDDKSRNTEENAQFAKQLAGTTAAQTWLLVTSAFHMPRSMGLFRAAGFDVLAWPTDYFASGEEGIGFKPDQAVENLSVSNIALREWLGLVGYRLAGKIADLVPGP